MNQHLSSEQISKWMSGDRTPQEEQHVRACPECSAEVVRLEATLQLFRGSVRRLSEQQRGIAPQTLRQALPARSPTVWRLRWALAVAALLIAVAIPLYKGAKNEQRQREMAKADAALLEQIDAEVSRAVPAPMEPLISLVAWDSTNTRGGVEKR